MLNLFKNISLLLCLFICGIVTAQEKSIQLIVRGDDMGFSHSANEALIKSYQNGIVSSIEVIVTTPWLPEAAKMLNENPSIDVGLHLTLTSEWDNVKWRPLTNCNSLKDENGYFYPMIFPNKNYPGKSIRENDWKIEEVEKEFRAQIELAQKMIPRVSHISGHMGCTDLSPEVAELSKRLAKEYNIAIDLKEKNVKTLANNEYDLKIFKNKLQSFLKTLGEMKAGETYMYIEHPGLNTDELRAISHIGYENVAEHRQGVFDLFTHKKVKAFMKKNNIKLIGYNDL